MKETSAKQAINILEIPSQDSILAVKGKTTTRFINLRDITHICSNGYLSILHTTSGKIITITKLLGQLEYHLNKYGFIRINRNAIVNILHVERYETGITPTIFLQGDKQLTVSRRRIPLINSLLSH